MKLSFIAVLLLIASRPSFAQISKGTFLIGVGTQLSGSTSKSPTGIRNNSLATSISLPVGIFIADNWLFGVKPKAGKNFYGGNYERLPNSKYYNYNLGITPSISKFWMLNEKWYFDIETGVNYLYSYLSHKYLGNSFGNDNITNQTSINKNKTFQFYIAPGINYFIKPKIMLSFQFDLFSISYYKDHYSHQDFIDNSTSWSYAINRTSNATASLKFLF